MATVERLVQREVLTVQRARIGCGEERSIGWMR